MADPFVAYSRALYDYTFRLWKESKSALEESTRLKSGGKEEGEKAKETAQSIKDHT